MTDADTVSANKAHFDKLAAEYDAKYEKTSLQLEREIRNRKDFIGVDWADDDDDDDDDDNDNDDTAETAPATDSKSVRLLDYACGTGLISRALIQYTTHCVGIDISENMVAAYNARAENQQPQRQQLQFRYRRFPGVTRIWFVGTQARARDVSLPWMDGWLPREHRRHSGPVSEKNSLDLSHPASHLSPADPHDVDADGGLSADEMRAYQGNLTDPADPDPAAFSGARFRDFDVAGVGLGFHHFADPELSAKRLVERLRPGGVFVILDFLPHEKMDNGLPAASTVMHHGFSEERMRAIFEQAGAGKDFAMEELGSGVVFGGHGHGHGDSHGGGHGHDHGHRDGHSHGHDHAGSKEGMKRRVFLARGTKA